MASHISIVSAVRTARALVRASSKQLRIEEGCGGEGEEVGDVLLVGFSYCLKKALAQPAVSTADSHSLLEPT